MKKPAAKKKAPKKRPRSANRKPAFLAAYKISANLTEAAAAANVDRTKHFDWMKEPDGAYRRAFNAAKLEASISLEDEAIERAKRGVYEPISYQGDFTWPEEEYEAEPAKPATEEGGKETPAVIKRRRIPGALPIGRWRKSDGLLMFLLRGFMPGKYRQHGAGPETEAPADAAPIPLTTKALRTLTDDELANLIATAQKLADSSGNARRADPPSA